MLFDMTGFDGWDAGAAWEDFTFDLKHLAGIDRLAMVGEKKWQHRLAVFFEPLTWPQPATSIVPTLPIFEG